MIIQKIDKRVSKGQLKEKAPPWLKTRLSLDFSTAPLVQTDIWCGEEEASHRQ